MSTSLNMDFSDFSDISDISDFSYPVIANTDYSPTIEASFFPDAFDKAYLGDSYTTSPGHSPANFFDCDSYFDRPLSSIEVPAPPKNLAIFTATLPAATTTSASPHSSKVNQAPFGQLEQFPSGFSFDPDSNAFESSASPRSQHSRTPSLRGDVPRQFQALSSPELSPHPTQKLESADEGVEFVGEPMPKRKRAWPRLDRSNSDTLSASSKCHRTNRVPHNQVERKYREGLNSELEKLRRAVPTLLQSEESEVIGQSKLSKAMVLAGALSYIKKIEKERDVYREENERLRALTDQSWSKRRADSVSEFLADT